MAEFNWIPTETFGATGFETEWITVAQARAGGAGADKALEKLCRTYWYPLYAYVRGKGVGLHEAQDLTQDFFSRLLTKDWLENVHQSKGRFRAFLLAAMNNFLTDEWRRGSAIKRGGGSESFSLDALAAEERYSLEPSHNESPDRLFDRSWAVTVSEQAISMLRDEYLNRDNVQIFDALKHTLNGGKSPERHAEIAKRLGLAQSALRKAAQRLRERYRKLLQAEIALTVVNPAELEEEIRHVLKILIR